jgi:hypothetical protein
MWAERLYRIVGNIIEICGGKKYMAYLGDTQLIILTIQLISLYAIICFYKLIKDVHKE